MDVYLLVFFFVFVSPAVAILISHAAVRSPPPTVKPGASATTGRRSRASTWPREGGDREVAQRQPKRASTEMPRGGGDIPAEVTSPTEAPAPTEMPADMFLPAENSPRRGGRPADMPAPAEMSSPREKEPQDEGVQLIPQRPQQKQEQQGLVSGPSMHDTLSSVSTVMPPSLPNDTLMPAELPLPTSPPSPHDAVQGPLASGGVAMGDGEVEALRSRVLELERELSFMRQVWAAKATRGISVGCLLYRESFMYDKENYSRGESDDDHDLPV